MVLPVCRFLTSTRALPTGFPSDPITMPEKLVDRPKSLWLREPKGFRLGSYICEKQTLVEKQSATIVARKRPFMAQYLEISNEHREARLITLREPHLPLGTFVEKCCIVRVKSRPSKLARGFTLARNI